MNGWGGRQGSGFVVHFDGQDWSTYRTAASFPGAFQVGAVTPDGRLWGLVPGRGLAAFDGRSWEDGDSWEFYGSAGGLSLAGGFHLTPGPDGTLWVTTPRGIARLDPQNPPERAWMVYAPVQDPTTSYSNAVAFAPDGAVWWGATKFRPGAVLPGTPCCAGSSAWRRRPLRSTRKGLQKFVTCSKGKAT